MGEAARIGGEGGGGSQGACALGREERRRGPRRGGVGMGPASGRTKQKRGVHHAYQWLLAAGRPKPGISQAALDSVLA